MKQSKSLAIVSIFKHELHAFNVNFLLFLLLFTYLFIDARIIKQYYIIKTTKTSYARVLMKF